LVWGRESVGKSGGRPRKKKVTQPSSREGVVRRGEGDQLHMRTGREGIQQTTGDLQGAETQ